MGIISSIYNSGYNIKRLFLGEQELKLAYLGEQIVFNEVIDDLNYVLYEFHKGKAISNTIEAPVKSAILKGNTLVNINRPITRNDNMKVENGLQILTTWTTAYNLWMVNDITLFKTNTKYYIIAEVIDNTLTSTWSPMIGSIDCVFSGSISSLNFVSKETGIKCATFTTKSDFTNVICGLRSATGTNETVGSILKFRIAIIEYQDGMENWDIPYFEGMQSVKMPVLTTSNEDGTKTNILTVNEDVTLRSNGDVYDELNLLTGRLTQRIDENNEVLAQEVVKTVDLTVVDQDEQTISKLNSFNGTTHVSTEVAENGIYPTIAIEVATE